MTEKTAKLDTATLFAKFGAFFKAIPNDKMEDITDVIDMWNEKDGEHKNPGRGEIVTGPAERMSGDGAPKMIAEYSSPAPQQGLTQQYQEFQRMLDGWAKSFTDKLNPVLSKHDKAITALVGVFSEMQKAHAAAPAAPAADTFLGKALLKIAKAKSELRKSELADEDDEKEEKKSRLAAASDLLKSAKRLLAKASEEMEDTDDEGTEKAMTSLRALIKAVSKAEEEEKEKEEAEKAKSVAAQKAIDDAAAATKKAEEDKKKEEEEAAEKAKAVADGTAAKAAATQEQVLKALEGNAVLQATVQNLFDAVVGKSVNPHAPEIAKGTVIATVDFAARAEEAREGGRLSDQGDLKVASILQHMGHANAGRMDMKVVEEEIAKSTSEVRAVFQVAA